MKKITLKQKVLSSVLMAAGAISQAAPYVIHDVQVNGLERLNVGTIYSNLNLKPGKTVDTKSFPELIRKLYATGAFNSVDLFRQGNNLVINVKERPVINEIRFVGNKDVKDTKFKEVLSGINFYEGQGFNPATLDSIKRNIGQLYESKGKYSVVVTPKVIELPRNRVDVEFNISEGITAAVKHINFTGNQVYSDSKLQKQMKLKTTNFLSFFAQDDRYYEDNLKLDLEKISDFYRDNGYMKFEVNNYAAQMSPDHKSIDVDIDVREGDLYTVTDYSVSGNSIVPNEELAQLIKVEKNAPYNRSKIKASVKAIEDRLGNDGYALAKVNAIPVIDEKTKTVNLTFAVDQGERAYVRRINIIGNERSQDTVFRREMRQTEGALYVASDIERSRLRIQRLPYVESVTAEPEPLGPDAVDINYKIKERSASSVQLGLSYAQDTKFGLNGSFNQANFMGTGNTFGISAAADGYEQSFGIKYTNPYFTENGVSLGVALNYKKIKKVTKYTASYLTDGYSAMLELGYPISEYSDLFFNVGYERLNIKTTADSPVEIVGALGGSCTQSTDPNRYGYCEPVLKPVTKNCTESLSHPGFCEDYGSFSKGKNLFRFDWSWQRDTRDRTVFSSEGTFNRVGLSGTLPGSTDQYYKVSLKHRSYFPLYNDDIVLALRAEMDYGNGYGKTPELPFYENYFAGGMQTVRGYRSSTLGPRYKNGEATGGAFRTNARSELVMSVPGFVENRNVRWSVFFDAGQVYQKMSDFDAGELRYSAGVSASWQSPIGPLSISFAQPIGSKKGDPKSKAEPNSVERIGDRERRFEFSIGIPF